MFLFRQRRRLRSWTFGVLLVWLFGLGLGVANACLAAQQFAGRDESAIGVAVGTDASPASMVADCDHRHAAAGAVSDQEHAAKSSCESFCERAGASTLPQKAIGDSLQWIALPTVALVPSLPASTDEPLLLELPRRDGAKPPPIPIVFLRLAL